VSATYDNELIQRFQGGDQIAFEELWIRYRTRVQARIRSIITNSSDVPDVEQEVLIKIYKGLPRFKGKCKFSTWLHPIVGNTCKDYLRRAGRAARVFESGSLSQRGPDSNGDERKDQGDDGLSERNAYSRYLAGVKRKDHRRLCLAVARSVLDEMSPRKRNVIRLVLQGHGPDELVEMGAVQKRAQATQIGHDYRERCRQVLREILVSRGIALASRRTGRR